MGLLTFALNVTLDGCCDHREMVADDEMLRYWTRVKPCSGHLGLPDLVQNALGSRLRE
jgi:hypothetical protein